VSVTFSLGKMNFVLSQRREINFRNNVVELSMYYWAVVNV
jgi:hypothetical protein